MLKETDTIVALFTVMCVGGQPTVLAGLSAVDIVMIFCSNCFL